MKFEGEFEKENYVTRIRESGPDLIYYDGFKVFEKDNKGIVRIIPNILTLNDKNYKNEDVITAFKNAYKKLEGYCDIKINETIQVKLSKKLQKHLKTNPDLCIKSFEEEAKSIEQQYNKKYKEYDNNIEKLVELQEFIIANTSGNKIKDTNEAKFLKAEIKVKFLINDYTGIDEIIKIVLSFCENYKLTSKELLEKSFQHSLMTSSLPQPLEDAYKFEMEYVIGKLGKIDNILIKDNKLIFIEAKVDDIVILGIDGIHKHLKDMDNWLNDKEIQKIFNLYNYRVSKLNDGPPIDNPSFETTYILLFAHSRKTCEEIENIIKSNNEYKDFKSIKYYIKSLQEKNCKVQMYTTKWDPINSKEINEFIEISNEEKKESDAL